MRAGIRESRASIRQHSRSFSLAARLLPEGARTRAVTVYAWCRRADDAIDLAPAHQQAVALERLRRELVEVYGGGEPVEPVLSAFRDTVLTCEIPVEYPAELLAGLEMDVAGHEYETVDDLLAYCHRVAGVVGLMMCHVMGVAREDVLRNAAHLGIGMQLTNICRDVMEDWQRGRLYLPARLVSDHGAPGLRRSLGGPLPHHAVSAVARATDDLLGEADRFYRSGDAGLSALGWRDALAIRTARRVYSAIGTRVRSAGCDPRAGRAVVPLGRKLTVTASAMLVSLAELPGRAMGGRVFARVPTSRVRFPDDVLPIEVTT